MSLVARLFHMPFIASNRLDPMDRLNKRLQALEIVIDSIG